MVYIENGTNEALEENLINMMKSVVEISCIMEKCPYPVEVSVTLVDEETIRNINNETRQKNSITDVLSFPLLDFTSPADFNQCDLNDEAFNLDTNELYIGDIIICYEQAKKQAKDYGHSLAREIGFLTAHSMLHLFGYDHIEQAEEIVMKSHQEAILSKVGLTR